MKQKQILATLILGVFIISMLGMISAQTLVLPAASGNYKSPITLTVTVQGNGANNMTNVTCYTNSSGGAATVFLAQMLNTTDGTLTFTTTGTIATESTTYNVSCNVYNGTTLNATLSNAGIIIDNTSPTLDIKETSVEASDPINYKCSDTYISTFNVVHTANSGATVTDNLYKSLSDYTQYVTIENGAYVFTCTDTAGNSATETITASAPAGFAQPPQVTTQGALNFQNMLKNPLIWIVGLGVLYLLLKKD